MSGSSTPRLLCPSCGGEVRPVRERRSLPQSVLTHLGNGLIADLVFWVFAIAIFAFFVWSFAAGATLVLLAGIALGFWFRKNPSRIAYRCEACNTVVTYQEVIALHEPAA
jgi:hypothetical protein